jgi:hypothetical protein
MYSFTIFFVAEKKFLQSTCQEMPSNMAEHAISCVKIYNDDPDRRESSKFPNRTPDLVVYTNVNSQAICFLNKE